MFVWQYQRLSYLRKDYQAKGAVFNNQGQNPKNCASSGGTFLDKADLIIWKHNSSNSQIKALYDKCIIKIEFINQEVTPIIDQKYDEIYDICQKANGLLGRP